jgi:flagella basal body P-ring formation protein FlgA
MMNLGPILLYSALAGGEPGCLAVTNPMFKAGEIASALPGLPNASEDHVLGYVPEPGAVRWWRGDALKALAARLGIQAESLHDFCVERKTLAYTKADVLSCLRNSLPAGVRVELIDHCRTPLPPGELRFDWRSIAANPCSGQTRPITWRGQALFSNKRSLPFWVIVRLSVERMRVFAASDVPPRTILKAEDVRREATSGSPFCRGEVGSVELAQGKETIRRIRAGVSILNSDLREPIDVMNGELIEVSASTESTRLQFTAKAVSRGRKGEVILVNDMAHRRVFRARVTGRNTANVEMDVLVASKPNRIALEPDNPSAGSKLPR